MPIKLIIADDQGLFRSGMVSLVEGFKGIEIIGEANDGKELLQLVKTKMPDIILLDLKMPNIDGMEATELLRSRYPQLKIIILSMYEEEKFISYLIQAGVNSYLVKNAEPEEVEMAIRKVMSEGYYFNESVMKVIHKGFLKKQPTKPEVNGSVHFSDREFEVMQLICEEKTNKEIANKLFISARTVANHRQNILQKTEAKNTVGIVLFAMRNGYIK